MAHADVLLPTHTKPLLYSVHITPNIGEFVFESALTIAVEIREPTSTVTMHANQLSIQSASIRRALSMHAHHP